MLNFPPKATKNYKSINIALERKWAVALQMFCIPECKDHRAQNVQQKCCDNCTVQF